MNNLREYKSLRLLVKQGWIEFEGMTFDKVEGELQPGDTYLAERNQGPKLLTVRNVDHNLRCVFPKEAAYPYDFGECIKVAIREE